MYINQINRNFDDHFFIAEGSQWNEEVRTNVDVSETKVTCDGLFFFFPEDTSKNHPEKYTSMNVKF
jgi:hypothetical protein